MEQFIQKYRQKRDYDTRVAAKQYKPGDLVYKRYHVHKKLEIPWQGPFVVLKGLGNSHDLLKPYLASFIPSWAIKLKEQVDLNCQ